MRLSRTATVSLLAASLGLALAACTPSQPAATPEPAVAPEAPAEAPAATADRAPLLSDDLIVSTNEPFWSARAEGATLTLSGIDGQRVLEIATSDVSDEARTVVAADANGQVSITVTPVECQDSMAGASFPFTGTLTIDGGEPITGCARPTWMPPPGEPL